MHRSNIPATGFRRILQENTGNRWDIEAEFRPENFQVFPVDSCEIPVFSGSKSSGKSKKFPTGILLPRNHRNCPGLAVSGPGCSNWVVIIKIKTW
jgi:hypothetical protein